jgi:hypothetical protein
MNPNSAKWQWSERHTHKNATIHNDIKQNDTQQSDSNENCIKQNDTNKNYTQQKDTKLNGTYKNDIQQNDTQQNDDAKWQSVENHLGEKHSNFTQFTQFVTQLQVRHYKLQE